MNRDLIQTMTNYMASCVEEEKTWIDHCRPHSEDKVITTIPTKSGYHLITKRFDVLEFKKKYPEIDIQKKNPTLLYLPKSLI